MKKREIIPILYTYFFSLLLLKLPPFYYLFFLQNRFFTSHTLAKIIIILLAYILIKQNNLRVIFNKKNLWLYFFFYFFLIVCSLSIILAQDLYYFWKDFQNIIIFFIIFIVSALLLKEKEASSKFDKFIFIIVLISVVTELFLIFFKSQSVIFFFQNEIKNAFLTDINRERYWFVINTEAFIPFLVFSLFSKIKKYRFLNFLLLILIIFLTSFSSVRTRYVQLIFSLGISFYILFYRKQKKRNTINKQFNIIFLSILCLLILTSSLTIFFKTNNILSRFYNILNNSYPINSDYLSFKSRLSFYSVAIDIFKSSPLIGVGLGNFVNYEILKYKFNIIGTGIKKYFVDYYKEVAFSPHNIFFELLSTTGLLGLISFVLIILFFLYKDIKTIMNNPYYKKIPHILSSWTIFLYTLFNPYNSIYIFGWFWVLRGYIN